MPNSTRSGRMRIVWKPVWPAPRRCTPRQSGTSGAKATARCPSAAGGAAQAPAARPSGAISVRGGTVRTLLFWLFTTLLSPILWLLDRLWLGAQDRRPGKSRRRAGRCGQHNEPCSSAGLHHGKGGAVSLQAVVYQLGVQPAKPFTGWLIRFCGGVPLPDDIHGMAALERGMEARIRGGAFVHFYPEGMLVPYHEGLRAFHPGAFATAVRAGCPVVPMMLCRRPARGLWAWRKKPCFTLRIGAPLYADASLPKKQAARDLQLRAEAAMLALERGETPPLAVGEPALDAE